jgi:hypothetical protein
MKWREIPMNETEVLFKEVQHFRQPLLWLLFGVVLVIIVGITGFLAVKLIFFSKPPHTGTGIALLIPSIVVICLGLLLFSAKLEVEVRKDGLYLRFFPFHMSFQTISLERLEKHEAITFAPLKDYGGWGIRYGKKGKAYIVSGNTGVLLSFKDGKTLCIGSQKAEELNDRLNNITK